MTKDNKEISKATLNRLPSYLKYLYQLDKLNVATVSSTTIANGLNLNPVQVRKDIALVSSVAGKPKMGYVTKEIIADLEGFWDITTLTTLFWWASEDSAKRFWVMAVLKTTA